MINIKLCLLAIFISLLLIGLIMSLMNKDKNTNDFKSIKNTSTTKGTLFLYAENKGFTTKIPKIENYFKKIAVVANAAKNTTDTIKGLNSQWNNPEFNSYKIEKWASFYFGGNSFDFVFKQLKNIFGEKYDQNSLAIEGIFFDNEGLGDNQIIKLLKHLKKFLK